jgi:hypothetical protein
VELNDYLRSLKKRSKADDIPGTVEEGQEEKCPACGGMMKKYKPCCGSPIGYLKCSKCGYKIA